MIRVYPVNHNQREMHSRLKRLELTIPIEQMSFLNNIINRILPVLIVTVDLHGVHIQKMTITGPSARTDIRALVIS